MSVCGTERIRSERHRCLKDLETGFRKLKQREKSKNYRNDDYCRQVAMKLIRDLRELTDSGSDDVLRFGITERDIVQRLERELNSSCEAYEKKANELDTEKTNYRESKERLEKELQQREDKMQLIKSELEECEKAKRILENDNKGLIIETERINTELEKSEEERRNLEAENTALTDQTKRLISELQDVNDAREELEKYKRLNETTQTQLEDERVKLETEENRQTNEDENKDLPEDLATLKEESYTALQRLNETTQKQLEDERGKLETEKKRQTNEDENKDLPEDLATFKEESYTALQRLEKELQQREDKMQFIKSELEEYEKAKRMLENDKKSLIIETKRINTELDKSEEERRKLEAENKNLTDQIKILLSELQDVNDAMKELETEYKRLNETTQQQLEDEREKLETEKNRQTNEDEGMDLPEDLATLKEERTYTALQRLRDMEKEVARLSPDTDLVGKDISVKMNELYDNEWSESKEVLEKTRGEISAIQILSIILMECFKMCQKYANDQHNDIMKALMLSEQINSDRPFAKLANDMQKAASFSVISNSCLLDEVKKEIKTLVGQLCDDYEPFIKKSVKYCWLMCVQDPSIHLDDYDRGLKINLDHVWFHKINTEHFPNIVVWPGIYQYKNGPLLCKGIIYADNRRTKQEQRTPQKTQQTQETNQQTQEIYRRGRRSPMNSKRRRSEDAKRSSAPDPKLQKTDTQPNKNEDPHTPFETAL